MSRRTLTTIVVAAGCCTSGLIQARTPVPAEAMRGVQPDRRERPDGDHETQHRSGRIQKYIWPGIAAQVSGSNMNAEKYCRVYSKSSEVGVKEAGDLLGQHKWELVKVVAEPTPKGKDYQLYGAPVRDHP